jgi:hypothetical protein
VVDKTAPCGKPDEVVLGVENASSRCTVKVRPSRNALRMKSRYVGSLKITSL